MDPITFFFLLSSLILAWLCVLRTKLWNFRTRKLKLPPGPFPFPIIGNIPQIWRNPHKTLTKLSNIYGPLMSLRLGNIHVVVVSSPEITKQILVKHDRALSIRPVPVAAQAHGHDKVSVAFLPVGSQWLKLRKICREQMFSLPRLDASRGLRMEKIKQLHDYVHGCCVEGLVVDIEKVAFITALNLMSATLFTVNFAGYDSISEQELKEIVQGVVKSISSPNLSDYFPILEMIDPQGIKKRADFCVGKLLGIFESIMDERLKLREKGCPRKNDLLEALLDLRQEDEYNFSWDEIKHLLLDLFLGGTDTTSNMVDWVMTELLINPGKLSKLKAELRSFIGDGKILEEAHISKLPYLQAVVKEVFRYHPPAPFLIPHKSEVDIEINGYVIPKDAQVIVNAWGVGRDPRIWLNPDSFEPERFLDSKIETSGQDFSLIPFGSGRRICPGFPLAQRMIHLMVGTLVHSFDWKVDELDTKEKFGLSLRRLVPLKAFPIKL